MPLLGTLSRDEVFRDEPENLARAYNVAFDDVAEFYEADYRSERHVVDRANDLRKTNAFAEIDRKELAAALMRYLRALKAPPESIASARKLAQPDCFAIVTGQQPVIAGGPCLLLYKVAHAVRLAAQLNAAGVNAVPVFWAAGEDHDIDEANSFVAHDASGKVAAIRLRAFRSGSLAPLERLKLPLKEDSDARRIEALIGEGSSRDEALALLGDSFGVTFPRAISRTLLRLFGSQGLVVMEPRLLRKTAGFKRIVAREIERPSEHRTAIDGPLGTLTKRGFETPLGASPYLNIFVIDRGKRCHIQRLNSEYAIDGRKDNATKADLLDELENDPGVFSTGLCLRPVVQSACLPTLAYVAGPAEIAYHGALKTLFSKCGVPMPALVPRWSFAVGESVEAVKQARELLGERELAAVSAVAAVSETANEAHAVYDHLRRDLGALSRPLEVDIKHLEGRVDKALHELRGRLLADPLAGAGLDAALIQSVRRLFPRNQPQERVISWLSLWPRWGKDLREVFATRDAFDFELGVVGENIL